MRSSKNIFADYFVFEIVLVLSFAVIVYCYDVARPTILSWLEEDRAIVVLPDAAVVKAEIADDAEERRIGLSEHVFLDPDRGMLFLFDEPSRPAFWMKDMDFPIDIIWLRDGTVIGIEPSMPVSTDVNPPSVRPIDDINQVLEVNAGFALKHGLKPGQTLDIKLP